MTQGVLRDPASRRRLDAMLRCVVADEVVTVKDKELPKLLRVLPGRHALARAGLTSAGQKKDAVVFARMDGEEIFPGYSWRELRSAGREAHRYGVLCHTAVEVQSAVGCPFDCTYCPYAAFMCVRLDVDTFVQRVATLAGERRSQALFKLNNRTDTLGMEPEYDLAPRLIERFAHLEGKYLMLYSKGNAVDALVDLDHRGKTVACFTLTPASVSSLIETSAPHPKDRLQAMARLAQAGYPLRVRFSPIVPVRDWQQSYERLLQDLAQVGPIELVTLWTLSMVDVETLGRIIPLEALDEEALDAARKAGTDLAEEKGAPFPPALRVKIYREVAQMARKHLPETAVSLCLETAGIWDAVGPLVVPRRQRSFVCNCGPQATPALVRSVRPRRTIG